MSFMLNMPPCFKNPDNPSSVDLFVTNFSRNFMKTTAVSTGLSDFHKMTVTVMRTTFPKAEPLVVRGIGIYLNTVLLNFWRPWIGE